MIRHSNFVIRTSARVATALHSDHGGAAVSFIITFPIFLWIVAILVQYALLVNAKVMVDYAAQQAARSAVTSLPEGQPGNVTSAAYLALAPLSPQATEGASGEAQTIYQALQTAGVSMPPTFPARYTYAMQATTVNWQPQIDFTTAKGQELSVSVVYRFNLSVPGAKMLIGKSDTVAGVDGRFFDIGSATVRAQTSHSRKTASDNSGWPN